jgi:hypothetical protein
VIEGRDDKGAFHGANTVSAEFVATPHPSLPLKGGGDWCTQGIIMVLEGL